MLIVLFRLRLIINTKCFYNLQLDCVNNLFSVALFFCFKKLYTYTADFFPFAVKSFVMFKIINLRNLKTIIRLFCFYTRSPCSKLTLFGDELKK